MKESSFRDELMNAYRRWQSTVSYFESVTDPELVEIAVFEMEAAQKYYVYLLEHADKELSA